MPRKKVKPPQSYSKWKPHTGPHEIEYIKNTDARRKSRNIRRKTLIQKSHELSVISNGQVFLLYIDDNGQAWVYTNDEEMWDKYSTTGLLKEDEDEKRCDSTGLSVVDKRVTVQSPTKLSRYDLSFATDIVQQEDLDNTPQIDPAIWDSVASSTPNVARIREHPSNHVVYQQQRIKQHQQFSSQPQQPLQQYSSQTLHYSDQFPRAQQQYFTQSLQYSDQYGTEPQWQYSDQPQTHVIPAPQQPQSSGKPPFTQNMPTPQQPQSSGQPPFTQNMPTPQQLQSSGQPPFTQTTPTPQQPQSSGQSPFTQTTPARQQPQSSGQPPFTQTTPARQQPESSGQPPFTHTTPARQHPQSSGQPPFTQTTPARQHPQSSGQSPFTQTTPARQQPESSGQPPFTHTTPARQHPQSSGQPPFTQTTPARQHPQSSGQSPFTQTTPARQQPQSSGQPPFSQTISCPPLSQRKTTAQIKKEAVMTTKANHNKRQPISVNTTDSEERSQSKGKSVTNFYKKENVKPVKRKIAPSFTSGQPSEKRTRRSGLRSPEFKQLMASITKSRKIRK